MKLIALLEFIEKNKFVLNKDGKWYSLNDYPRIMYKDFELIKLIETV